MADKPAATQTPRKAPQQKALPLAQTRHGTVCVSDGLTVCGK